MRWLETEPPRPPRWARSRDRPPQSLSRPLASCRSPVSVWPARTGSCRLGLAQNSVALYLACCSAASQKRKSKTCANSQSTHCV